MTILNRISPSQVTLEIKDPVDPTALIQAREIISQIRSSPSGPVDAVKLLAIAHKFGDISTSVSSYIISPQQCKDAFDSLPQGERQALIQIHHRIQTFAQAQRRSVVDMEVDIPGGKAGHTVQPCKGKDNGQVFLHSFHIWIVFNYFITYLLIFQWQDVMHRGEDTHSHPQYS